MKLKVILLLLATLTSSVVSFGQTNTKNYVMSLTARDATITNLNDQRANQQQVQTDIVYVDGLGRTSQEVMREASPAGKDMVIMHTYDAMGRQDKAYLPYESTSTGGGFQTNPLTGLNGFYDDQSTPIGVSVIDYPYSQTLFDPSPLNRVIETSSPGNSWRSSIEGGTHVVSQAYQFNAANEIRLITVDNSTNQVMTATEDYPANELQGTLITDEDGNKMLEYSNKTGQIICKINAEGTTVETHTYYVYDEYNLLTFVIPPQAIEEIGTNWSLLNDTDFRNKWLFCYKYDHRNRMIEKQVPGAEKVEMVYDKRDRLVFTLDGNRRTVNTAGQQVEFVESGTRIVTTYEGKSYVRAPGAKILFKKPDFQASKQDNFSVTKSTSTLPSEWLYTKYDELNRPVMTGIISIVATRASLQQTIDNHTNYDFSVNYVGTASGNIHGYDNSSYPSASGTEILTVTYYDNYEFLTHFNWDSVYSYSGHFSQTKGLVTGSLTKLLESNPVRHLKSVTYYDDRLRPKATMTENYFGKVDEVVTTYKNDVSPLVSSTRAIHRKDASATTIDETFTYDHRDRLVTQTHAIVGNGTKTLSSNTYNAIGQLIEKDLHDDVSPAQSIDYRYNERGWLTTINGGPNNLTGNDKFGLELQYGSGSNPKYNGNIGKMLWKSLGGTNLSTATQGYQYNYDALNRLTLAEYFPSSTYDVSNITYDKNGNILTLKRNTIDNLDYDYKGNRLTRVEDATNNTTGFEDVSSAVGAQEYKYDKNGNMISDTNKGITNIQYNYLNLPQQVTLNDNTTVQYTYDAAGIKHRKTVDDGSPETTTYANGFHYKDNTLQFVQHAEGRARYNSGSWLYEYNLTDHLGNVRVSVNESGDVVQRDGYYPFGGTFNSSATSPENLYKYNGKEEQKETDWYDYGARMQDPWLGRFFTQDRFSEKYLDSSPYHYTLNNPINSIDINGDSVWVYTEQIKSTGNLARHSFLRVKTDEVDVIVELWGPNETRTGLPKMFDFSQGQIDGRSGVEEGEVERPEGVPEGDYSFENSILELASFFMEESEPNSEDYVNLPDYEATGPNSNGYVKSLVEMSGGQVDLPFNAFGKNDTGVYKKAVIQDKADGIREKLQELTNKINELQNKLKDL